MILNEEEVQTGLSFVLKDVFKKYDIVMQEMHIKLADEKLLMNAVLLYNDQCHHHCLLILWLALLGNL